MAWPLATDYNAAVQAPAESFADPDLRQGRAAGGLFGLPKAHSGNFADVYQIVGPDEQSWAVKCFTRAVRGLRHRYQAISDHLGRQHRPFMVDFKYLEEGIRVRGQWYPALKMRWVEGFTLNEFLRDHVDKPAVLEKLGQLWLRLSQELRESKIAHGDLQHGNVLLVPGRTTGSLALRLIDYDGMFVPALADKPSGEIGHANYQHPQRLRDSDYDFEVDRFSHLVIYTAFRCLAIGGRELWDRFDNAENLLFRAEDFTKPAESKIWPELLKLPDASVRSLVGHLIQACRRPRTETPLLDQLAPGGAVRPFNIGEQAAVRSYLDMTGPNPWLLPEPAPPPAAPPPESAAAEKPGKKRSRLVAIAAASILLLAGAAWLLWPTQPAPAVAGPRRPKLLPVAEIALIAGRTNTVAVGIDRQEFAGPLTLRFENLPETIKTEPVTMEAEQSEANLEFKPALTADEPPRPVTLSLLQNGNPVDQSTVMLGVRAVPLPRLLNYQVKLRAGEEQTFQIPIERNGCDESVALKVEGLPAGVDQLAEPPSRNAKSIDLRLRAARDVPPRTTVVTVTLWIQDYVIPGGKLTITVENPKSDTRASERSSAS